MVTQEQRRQHTVRILLDTVQDLIQVNGCDAVTMQDIMNRSGLSKGAIFHYVKSKDELFTLVLRQRLEEIDHRFKQEAFTANPGFDGPFQAITARLADLQDPDDTTNQILAYLLGKKGRTEVDEVLAQFYEQSARLAREWIKAGQEAGVIPLTVDADKVGELFVLITLGLRMRAFLPGRAEAFTADDFAVLMRGMLLGTKD